MNLAENRLQRSHAHGRRQAAWSGGALGAAEACVFERTLRGMSGCLRLSVLALD